MEVYFKGGFKMKESTRKRNLTKDRESEISHHMCAFSGIDPDLEPVKGNVLVASVKVMTFFMLSVFTFSAQLICAMNTEIK